MRKPNKDSKMIIALLAIIICAGCGDPKVSGDPAVKYLSAEIYCWCFSHDPVEESKSGDFPNGFCQPIRGITPSELIKQRHLFTSINDGAKVTALRNVIFEGAKTPGNGRRFYPDSRFLILFKNDNTGGDTVVYSYPNKLYLNGSEIFTYSFNVIDSIRKILKEEKIFCSDR